MIFYKIYLINDYETEQEISNRALSRGYNKVGANLLIEDKPFILVFVDNDLLVHEYYTGLFLKTENVCGNSLDDTILSFNDLVKFDIKLVPQEELNQLKLLRNNKSLKKVIKSVIFKENNDLLVSTDTELEEDKRIQLDAYNRRLTNIDVIDMNMNNKSLRLVR